jgi:hypothetical protein
MRVIALDDSLTDLPEPPSATDVQSPSCLPPTRAQRCGIDKWRAPVRHFAAPKPTSDEGKDVAQRLIEAEADGTADNLTWATYRGSRRP